MKDSEAKTFLLLILELILNRDLEFTRYEEPGEAYLENRSISFKIDGTDTAIAIERTTDFRQYNAAMTDPRLMGDSDAVTAGDMKEYREKGGVERCTEKKTTVTIAATGLPDFGSHVESYKVNEYDEEEKRVMGEMFDCLWHKFWQSEQNKGNKVDTDKGSALKAAFSKI